MRAQTILFLLVDRVREKLDCRPYRGRGEGNPKRLVEAASRAFPTRSIILTIRDFCNKLSLLRLLNHFLHECRSCHDNRPAEFVPSERFKASLPEVKTVGCQHIDSDIAS